MKRQTEFFEEESGKNRVNIIIAVVSIVTLLLTGVLFSNGNRVDAGSMTDINTVESYGVGAITE